MKGLEGKKKEKEKRGTGKKERGDLECEDSCSAGHQASFEGLTELQQKISKGGEH